MYGINDNSINKNYSKEYEKIDHSLNDDKNNFVAIKFIIVTEKSVNIDNEKILNKISKKIKDGFKHESIKEKTRICKLDIKTFFTGVFYNEIIDFIEKSSNFRDKQYFIYESYFVKRNNDDFYKKYLFNYNDERPFIRRDNYNPSNRNNIFILKFYYDYINDRVNLFIPSEKNNNDYVEFYFRAIRKFYYKNNIENVTKI